MMLWKQLQNNSNIVKRYQKGFSSGVSNKVKIIEVLYKNKPCEWEITRGSDSRHIP